MGRIKVARFQGLGKDSPLTQIGSTLNFQRSTNIPRPQRRPQLASAPGVWGQAKNVVLLAYGDTALSGKDELHFWTINFRPGTPVVAELPFRAWLGRSTTEHMGLPSVFATPFMAGCVATEEKASGAGRVLAVTFDSGTMQSHLRPMVGRPWRLAITGRKVKSGEDLVALVYEGDGAGVSANYK